MRHILAIIGVAVFLTGCQQSLSILEGASHACGIVHIEGYFTDTQGEVVIAKAPDEWTPEQVQEFCSNGD
jgi:hypothetical protein